MLRIRGVVQGVGFRPFIWRLAKRNGLSGFVRNESWGVLVRLQGERASVESFMSALAQELPPAAKIEELTVERVPPQDDLRDFEIVASVTAQRVGLVPPDLAVCSECLKEMFDPQDRRYLYPMINCTNCGPRFTIVRAMPYDRPNTTMSVFAMCPRCRSEYEDPSDRRYHAQPIACPDCGPQYFFTVRDESGRPSVVAEGPEAFELAARALRDGKILAVHGIGGFHIACDASDGEAISRLRRWKNRPTKPFAVMVASAEVAKEIALLSPSELEVLSSPAAPILLLRKKESGLVHPLVAPGLACVGVFLPYAPAHHLLFHFGAPRALIATSGNRRDEPIAKDPDDAFRRIDIADGFLWHNRGIHNRADDSVGFVLGGKLHLIRRARGFVPERYPLPRAGARVLAAGADMKGSIAVSDGEFIYPSQYIGELDDALAQDFWRETVDKFLDWLQVKPDVVVCDLHPDYHSTRLAQEISQRFDAPLLRLQHHEAHLWGAVAESGLREGTVVAAVFDGTGFGADGSVWGGEFFVADVKRLRCKRVGHLKQITLPGGDAAAVKIARMAYAYLLVALGSDARKLDIPLWRHLTSIELSAVERMVAAGKHPLTSSVGRLFDAAAATAGIAFENEYEAQAPMLLEAKASKIDINDILSMRPYSYFISFGDDIILDPAPAIACLARDASTGVTPDVLSARFHLTVAHATAQILRKLAEKYGTDKIVLSGGVFQNRLLLTLLRRMLAGSFELLVPRLNPANDQGVALGQAFWGALYYSRGSL